MAEFQGWPKIARLNRTIMVTEKIDGTNAAIHVKDRGMWNEFHQGYRPEGTISRFKGYDGRAYDVSAQSRKRLIWPGSDNFGFASWVADHAADLIQLLGPGVHFGEWWGSGIQRGYGQEKGLKHFSLFNAHKHADLDFIFEDGSRVRPVPVLYHGEYRDFDQDMIDLGLRTEGSQAAPGFDRPEGFIVFHEAARTYFKVLLEGDDAPKGLN